MRLRRRLLIACVLFGSISVNGQVASEIKNLDQLVEASELILVGEAISNHPVVRKDKFNVGRENGNYSLPRESEYLLGTETAIRVTSWVKADKDTGKLKIVRVLVPGLNDESPIIMLPGKTYLLFLKKTAFNPVNFVTAKVLRSHAGLDASENSFNIAEYFGVTGGRLGVITDDRKINDFVRKYRTK